MNMTQSVVAVFPSREQAEAAKKQLVAGGLPAERVSLHADSPAGTSAYSGETRESAVRNEGIGEFFRSMFGFDDDRPGYYEEAARRGHVTLVADATQEEEVEQIRAILERYDVIDIDERGSEWRSGIQGRQGATTSGSSTSIPVIEEEVQIGKRQVERGGVRVYSRIMERPVEESIQLREERARVTRQPADRPATEADLAAFKEGSLEIRETAEVPVVNKRARVVEEVQVDKQVEEHAETVRDTVRKTDVRVEEKDTAPMASEGDVKTRRDKTKPR
jgi:stress response protein YsnF